MSDLEILVLFIVLATQNLIILANLDTILYPFYQFFKKLGEKRNKRKADKCRKQAELIASEVVKQLSTKK